MQPCYMTKYEIAPDASKMDIPIGEHDSDYYFYVTVTNRARLSTTERLQGSVNAAWGESSKSEKQKFMSLIEADIIRYEIFLDAIKPDDLTLSFLRDFLSLPKNFITGKAELQEFIIRYGTHYIKSAKFGGSFQLYKTQEATKSESLESFSVSAQASYSGMFSAGAHYGRKEESGSASSQKSSSTHLVIEGGDQKVAGIVADFYTTNFKDTFTEWLKSVPTYPKPIDMFMGTLSELLNLNFKLLFPFDVSDAADGCFSKKYCDDTSVEEFQLSMDKKRLALERGIAVYMEEGPIPTTDFHLEGGKPGCQTDLLMVKGGDAGVAHPSWLDLINGDTYKIFFDLQRDISKDISKDTEAYVVYSEGSVKILKNCALSVSIACVQYPLSYPQYLDACCACSTHSADHNTWTPAMHAVPTQLTTVPGLQPCMQYPLSYPQYLDSSHACSTHSAGHSTWTPAMHAAPTKLTTIPGRLLCIQYPLSYPQYLDSCCACSTHSAGHNTWTPAIYAVPTQLTTVPGLQPFMQYPLSWAQYLDSCCAFSTHSAIHNTWTPAVHAVPSQLGTISGRLLCMQYPLS
uniref:MACPF domain-containing protein n=1 Tax=Branchiostoma floridae TaxID=7739 RepID=C4A0J5_BRAFL|eukprot:XP_002585675.1 hypothetical protein BRAFLDRAFT_111559 [Branchiostoma floridae]